VLVTNKIMGPSSEDWGKWGLGKGYGWQLCNIFGEFMNTVRLKCTSSGHHLPRLETVNLESIPSKSDRFKVKS